MPPERAQPCDHAATARCRPVVVATQLTRRGQQVPTEGTLSRESGGREDPLVPG
jgi:hypothetical protein